MARWFEYFPVNKGDIVVDLGACVGEATLVYAMRVGRGGLVVALEPDITNFRVLQNTAIKRGLSNVVLLLGGIARETGRACLSVGGWNAHSTALSGKRFFGKRFVPVISWDDLVCVTALNRVDLAKINVEGAEVGCLEGMTKALPKKICLDEHSRFGVDLDRLLGLLAEKGYEIVHRHENLIYAVLK